MTTNTQLSTTEPKKNKNKLRKQLEQEHNYRKRHQKEEDKNGRKRIGEKIQEIRNINGRYKIDGGWGLRIVQEMEKPKNLYA